MHQIREGISKLVPVMAEAESVRQFAGLRAVRSTGDYIIRASAVSSRILHVSGIPLTGLSAAPAIGGYAHRLFRGDRGPPHRYQSWSRSPGALTALSPSRDTVTVHY